MQPVLSSGEKGKKRHPLDYLDLSPVALLRDKQDFWVTTWLSKVKAPFAKFDSIYLSKASTLKTLLVSRVLLDLNLAVLQQTIVDALCSYFSIMEQAETEA